MWSSWDSNRRPMADREPEAAPTVRVLSIEDLTQIAEHREMHERSLCYILSRGSAWPLSSRCRKSNECSNGDPQSSESHEMAGKLGIYYLLNPK